MEEKKLPQGIDKENYPDFWDQMNNFQNFLKDVGQGVKEGNTVFVTEEKKQLREKLCNECSSFNSASKRCKMCGCFMETKWRFTKAKCPKMLW